MPEIEISVAPHRRRRFITLSAAGLGAFALQPAAARELGDPGLPYGERSRLEQSTRTFGTSMTPGTGSSRTLLQDLYGTIGSYWPYATTVWDYINRAMPY